MEELKELQLTHQLVSKKKWFHVNLFSFSAPKTTVIPTRKEEVMIKFMADAESIGDPNDMQNALDFYNNVQKLISFIFLEIYFQEREFIHAVTDQLFAKPADNNNVCTFYMHVAFYGYCEFLGS